MRNGVKGCNIRPLVLAPTYNTEMRPEKEDDS